ncbi:MAG: thioredoxin fold domain-containing protein [Oscillospiraceae bacterium]|nr:thioredoxin fold domain-containing protein [Oscillospiraceae bacterium]
MLFHTSGKYFSEILEESKKKPVLVDFYASWCMPCRILEPELDAFSEIYYQKISAYSVNVDTDAKLAECYQIKNLPTVIIFHNQQPVQRWEKEISITEIEKFITSMI